MDDRRPHWAVRLQNEREARCWGKRELARRLYRAAGIRDGNVASLARQVTWWEAGNHFPRDWAAAYATAFGLSEADLFEEGPARRQPLSLLLTKPSRGLGGEAPRFPAVERVEALLRRLYRLEAEFGGDELCGVVAEQVEAASGVFGNSTLDLHAERRLYTALAGLTQIAGWLAIDASRPSEASRHLAAAVYAAHEIDDLGLAAHAMGYMSLHDLYRGHPRKALTLANTASTLAEATGSPRTRAILHERAARAHARLGENDACRRRLDLAETDYAADPADAEPEWTGYVSEVEIAAQRGACLLDLGASGEAATALEQTIASLERTAPEHHRDLAHYKTRLASALLRQGEPEQAAHVAEQAHELAMQIGSARVDERFRDLIAELEPFDVPPVRDLVSRVKDR